MYSIKIINNISSKDFEMLKDLIKRFAVNIFIVQKFDLQNKSLDMKKEYISNYIEKINREELKKLNKDIAERISFAKKSIKDNNQNKITKYFVLYDEDKIIGFQTAQIRNNNDIIEGWRNFAYIDQEYAGNIGIVTDTYGDLRKGVLSNVVYENITKWFHNNKVTIEWTATGKNMKKNILTYMVLKGFCIEKEDETRVYLMKNYSNMYSRDKLKRKYAEYISKLGLNYNNEKNVISDNVLLHI